METRAVIIHGSGGNPERNWFPWLAAQLAHRGVPVIVPRFPTPKGQSLESWIEVFESEVGEISHDLVLFGHSIGAAMILNLLQRSRISAKASFLVAGFVGALGHQIFDPLNKTFFEEKFDWEQIRINAGKLFLYSGDNDPYVPLERGRELARYLEGELSVIQGGGHLNQDAGFTTFPRLLEDFDTLLSERISDND